MSTTSDGTSTPRKSGAPVEHQRYLKKSFVPKLPLPRSKFSQEEIENLVKYGSWLSALQEGLIAPYTDAQRHFIAVMKDKALPSTFFETAWKRYLSGRDSSSPLASAISNADPALVWNEANFEEIVAMQQDCGAVESAHQYTGGVMDQDDENYDPTAIK